MAKHSKDLAAEHRYRVAVVSVEPPEYPADAPFHPTQAYPEFAGYDLPIAEGPPNRVFEGIRATFKGLNLDCHRAGTAEWNPLSEFIVPGSKVVIKPNLVLHESGLLVGMHCLTTHGSVIRALVDYAYLALAGRGELTIADAPLQSARFDLLTERTGLLAIQRLYRERLGFELRIVDLRQIITKKDDETGFIGERKRASGDPKGYTVVNLGLKSAFENFEPTQANTRYRVSDYDGEITQAMHEDGAHRYVISNTILDADTVLVAPKLKVHEKVGLTSCLKGMVGIIGSKDCLPHFRQGSPVSGGDEFPNDGRWLGLAWSRVRDLSLKYAPEWAWRTIRGAGKALARAIINARGQRATAHSQVMSRPVLGGAWPGNDTAWRMTLDLNYIFRFARTDGSLADAPQRRCFAIVDGIIGGEGTGPLRPSPRPAGLLIAGENPWAVDATCAELIGLDWRELRLLRTGWPWADLAKLQGGNPTDFIGNGKNVDWSDLQQFAKPFVRPPHW